METLKYPKETKARKQYSCDFCGERILIGEMYTKSTHVYDGQVYDWKTHNRCAKLATRLNMYEDCYEGVTQDDFMEIVSEVHDDILIRQIPNKDARKYSDIIQQLRKVRFRDKLNFVIRHYKKVDNV